MNHPELAVEVFDAAPDKVALVNLQDDRLARNMIAKAAVRQTSVKILQFQLVPRLGVQRTRSAQGRRPVSGLRRAPAGSGCTSRLRGGDPGRCGPVARMTVACRSEWRLRPAGTKHVGVKTSPELRRAPDSPDPATALLTALLAFDAVRIRQASRTRLTDIRDGRLHIGDLVIPLGFLPAEPETDEGSVRWHLETARAAFADTARRERDVTAATGPDQGDPERRSGEVDSRVTGGPMAPRGPGFLFAGAAGQRVHPGASLAIRLVPRRSWGRDGGQRLSG
jgi:hypothetical protein